MAGTVLKNCRVYVDGYDLSGYTNQINLDYGCNLQDNTVFGQDTKTVVPGLYEVGLSVSGWAETLANSSNSGWKSEDVAWNKAGSTSDQVVAVCPTSFAAGQPVYWFKGAEGAVKFGGKVGDLNAYSANLKATGGQLYRGTIVDASTIVGTSRSTTSAIYNVGAPNATQLTYAVLELYKLTSSTATILVSIQSATAIGFASPTTQFTFAISTGTPKGVFGDGVDVSTSAAYWRAAYTITGQATDLIGVMVGISHV